MEMMNYAEEFTQNMKRSATPESKDDTKRKDEKGAAHAKTIQRKLNNFASMKLKAQELHRGKNSNVKVRNGRLFKAVAPKI